VVYKAIENVVVTEARSTDTTGFVPTLRTCTLLTQSWTKKLYPSKVVISLKLFSGVGTRSVNKVMIYVWILHLWPQMIALSNKTRFEVRVVNHSRQHIKLFHVPLLCLGM